jgi:lysyl-tRNA synthetase class 2
MNVIERSEQEVFRRQSLEELRKRGIDPFPAKEYPVTDYSTGIKETFDDNAPRRTVSIAGRMMSRRIMGKVSFAELQDSKGRIQLYINRDDLCPGDDKDAYNTVFKKLLDIGDFIGVEGYVFRTMMGEISVHVSALTVLAKSLRQIGRAHV